MGFGMQIYDELARRGLRSRIPYKPLQRLKQIQTPEEFAEFLTSLGITGIDVHQPAENVVDAMVAHWKAVQEQNSRLDYLGDGFGCVGVPFIFVGMLIGAILQPIIRLFGGLDFLQRRWVRRLVLVVPILISGGLLWYTRESWPLFALSLSGWAIGITLGMRAPLDSDVVLLSFVACNFVIWRGFVIASSAPWWPLVALFLSVGVGLGMHYRNGRFFEE